MYQQRDGCFFVDAIERSFQHAEIPEVAPAADDDTGHSGIPFDIVAEPLSSSLCIGASIEESAGAAEGFDGKFPLSETMV